MYIAHTTLMVMPSIWAERDKRTPMDVAAGSDASLPQAGP